MTRSRREITRANLYTSTRQPDRPGSCGSQPCRQDECIVCSSIGDNGRAAMRRLVSLFRPRLPESLYLFRSSTSQYACMSSSLSLQSFLATVSTPFLLPGWCDVIVMRSLMRPSQHSHGCSPLPPDKQQVLEHRHGGTLSSIMFIVSSI